MNSLAQWKAFTSQKCSAIEAVILMDWDELTYPEITNLFRVATICGRVKNIRHATKLWNAIDNMDTPGPLWDIMLYALPWAFSDARFTNSIRIAY